jgi:hypothetical protein
MGMGGFGVIYEGLYYKEKCALKFLQKEDKSNVRGNCLIYHL